MHFGIWAVCTDFKAVTRPLKSLYIGRIFILHNIINHFLILTATVYLRLAEKNMLRLFKSHTTISGDLRSRDSMISASISGGAEADNAMNGADISALNPPIILNDFLKSCPLPNKHICIQIKNKLHTLTILIYNVLRPLQLTQPAS